MLAEGEVAAVADFQTILSGLLQLQRGPDGRFPPRDAQAERLLPMDEYLRQTALTYARERDIPIAATNSDGRPDRRAALLAALGPGATERVIDPGREVVAARLADPVSGALSGQCGDAIERWYGAIEL